MCLPLHRAIMADHSTFPALSVRDLLERLNLHVNEPEPTIICRTCQFALNGINSLADHVVEKHKLPKSLAKEASRQLRPYTTLGPKELRLRPDHSLPHPHLSKHLGVKCKHCELKTTSTEVLSRHLSKEHGIKRKTAAWRGDIHGHFRSFIRSFVSFKPFMYI